MTKSTITREESIQAVFDLKAGYTLGFADIEILKRVARMALAAMDSESGCLPLDYLQGHRDGLEWASQLAEANHPETGDWLYDDPIELAKAIRKGPDMPPAQLAPVVPEEATPDSIEILASARRRDHAVFQWDEDQRNAAADSWNACRAAMLAAAPQSPGGDHATVPGKWIPVSEQMPELDARVLLYFCDYGGHIEDGCIGDEGDGPYHYFFDGDALSHEPTHWMPLPAGPKEVQGDAEG